MCVVPCSERPIVRIRRRPSPDGRDPQRQHELVGQMLADRHTGRHVFLGLAQGLLGHVLGTDAQLAESGEDFGDVLRLQLDHHHVARPTGVLDLLDREAIGIPAGFLGNGALPFGNVPWQVGHQGTTRRAMTWPRSMSSRRPSC